MLVITRREGEEVVIGDPKNPLGVLRIASVKGDRVRIAFDFPRDVDIHRREIADQILAQDGAGSLVNTSDGMTVEVIVKSNASPAPIG